MSKLTKYKIKKDIAKLLEDKFQSTLTIANKINRSWQLTEEMLKLLEKERLAERMVIGTVKAWKIRE